MDNLSVAAGLLRPGQLPPQLAQATAEQKEKNSTVTVCERH
jgi:hypothetical protein